MIREINTLMNFVSQNGIDALVLGFRELDVGTAPVGYSAFTNQHPVFGGGLYRLKTVDGVLRFEMVGQSWMRHAFFALSDGSLLHLLADRRHDARRRMREHDTRSRPKGSSEHAGPRWQVNAFTAPSRTRPRTRLCRAVSRAAPGARRRPRADRTAGLDALLRRGDRHRPDDAAAGNGENNAA